ncbi:MAG: pyruvate kinase [Candidatus Eisenbacteria bacterium]|nr:pyruvate kinase [Candidatus Eisenbacteria bacterium]
MHIRPDGRPLRTRIVATLGALKHEVHNPDGTGMVAFTGEERDWRTFLGWFRRGGHYMIDVLRINMSFFDAACEAGEGLGAKQSAPRACKERIILNWLRDNREDLGDVSVLGDLPGPKLRLMGVGTGVSLKAGEEVLLRLTGDISAPTICAYGRPIGSQDASVAKRLSDYIAHTERPIASVGDGLATLRLVGATPDQVRCVAEDDGRLDERKGVTFKGLSLDLWTFDDDDKVAVDFLLEHGIDWKEHPWERASCGSFLAFIAVSFVRRAEDIEKARRYIEDRVVERLRPRFGDLGEETLRREARNFAPGVIAKIETRDATEDIERIMDVADGAMVARGDLALQIGPHNVPAFQKRLIRLCNVRGKPVITATQMLSSMVSEPEPTRAEASDVFNAILDGTDAVMLSDETAAGVYPFQSVSTMTDIAEAAEAHMEGRPGGGPGQDPDMRRLAERRTGDLVLDSEAEIVRTDERLRAALGRARASGDAWLEQLYAEKLQRNAAQKITDEISAAACSFSSSSPDCTAIVAPTTSGRTVRMISRFRPNDPILGCAHDSLNRKKLSLSFGVYAVNCGRTAEGTDQPMTDTEDVFRRCSGILKEQGMLSGGELIVWTAGSALFVPGTTNLIKIRRVE